MGCSWVADGGSCSQGLSFSRQPVAKDPKTSQLRTSLPLEGRQRSSPSIMRRCSASGADASFWERGEEMLCPGRELGSDEMALAALPPPMWPFMWGPAGQAGFCQLLQCG